MNRMEKPVGKVIPFSLKLFASTILLIIGFLFAMKLGAAHTSWQDVLLSFTSNPKENVLILKEIRFPREVGAVFVGAALAVSGAIMQGMTRNPLADPGLLGLTAGANAALAIALAFIPTINYIKQRNTLFI